MFLFSERELMLSPVRLSSVTFVRTQAVQIFSNFSTALGTLAMEIVPREPFRWGS